MLMKAVTVGGGGGGYVDKSFTISSDSTLTQTFDFSDVPNYTALTNDSFSLIQPNIWVSSAGVTAALTVTYSYNATTGALTVTLGSRNNVIKFNSGTITIRASWN